MCNRCVAVDVISASGVSVHIGYGDPDEDPYEKLLYDDIVLDDGETQRQLSQEDFLTLWDSLREKEGFGVIDRDRPPEENQGCGVCGAYLATVPGVDGECEVCQNTKHETIKHISENREEMRREMEEFFGAGGAGDGKQNDPLELAVRAGLHCPNGHWVCADCLTYRRDEL